MTSMFSMRGLCIYVYMCIVTIGFNRPLVGNLFEKFTYFKLYYLYHPIVNKIIALLTASCKYDVELLNNFMILEATTNRIHLSVRRNLT